MTSQQGLPILLLLYSSISQQSIYLRMVHQIPGLLGQISVRYSLKKQSHTRKQRKKGEKPIRSDKQKNLRLPLLCKAAQTSIALITQITRITILPLQDTINTIQGQLSLLLQFSKNWIVANSKLAQGIRLFSQANIQASQGHKLLKPVITIQQPPVSVIDYNFKVKLSISSQDKSNWINQNQAKVISFSSVLKMTHNTTTLRD